MRAGQRKQHIAAALAIALVVQPALAWAEDGGGATAGSGTTSVTVTQAQPGPGTDVDGGNPKEPRRDLDQTGRPGAAALLAGGAGAAIIAAMTLRHRGSRTPKQQ